MNLTISTIISSVFFGSMIFCIQHILLKSIVKNTRINSNILTIIYLVFILRMLFPFEFYFTKTVKSKVILPMIRDFFRIEFNLPFSSSITLFDFFIVIWILGIIFKIFQVTKKYYDTKKIIRLLDYSEYSITGKNNKEYPVIIIEGLHSPAVSGFRKPIILLPRMEFTNQELNYIFSHELVHIYNNDILAKYFYEIILAVYWWNPVMYFFRNQMNQIIELRTDDLVTVNLSDSEKKDYISTLVKVRKFQIKQNTNNRILNYLLGPHNFLLGRSHNILNKNKKIIRKFLVWPVVIILFFISNTIIFEAYSINKETTGNAFIIDKKSTYLLEVNSNKYEMYHDGEFVVTINKEQLQKEEYFKDLEIRK